MKKILIFTASTGGGHNEAALSLEKGFIKHGYSVRKIDAFLEINRAFDTIILNSHKMLINNFPKLYGNLYDLSNNQKSSRLIVNPLMMISKEKLYNIIIEEKPDLIISTHVLLVGIIGYLKEKRLINIPFISVVTDYEAHGTYIDKNVDAYIAGCEYTSESLRKQGVAKERIFSYGIPIKEEFVKEICQVSTEPRPFQILIMAGSLGLKGIIDTLDNLVKMEGSYNITAVCGQNQKLKSNIEKKYFELIKSKRIIVYGYTNKIPFIMENSDIIITKPGGLTISEAIAKKLPMVIPFYIPGQEKENLDFLLKNGLAFYVSKIDTISQLMEFVMKNPRVLDQIRDRMKEFNNSSCLDNVIGLSKDLIDKSKSII